MSDKRVLEVGTASVENIKRCVGVLKTAIKTNKEHKPSITVYGKGGDLLVGLYGSTNSKKAYEMDNSTVVINFTEQDYLGLAQGTEDVLKIAKMIQANAQIKVEKQAKSLSSKSTDAVLESISEFLDAGNSCNILYTEGVAGYGKNGNESKKEILDDIKRELSSGKQLKGVQIMGIPQVSLYIKLKADGAVEVSITYLGLKDNVYETVKWDGKKSIKDFVAKKVKDAKTYDSELKVSVLDKEN